jgi:hypothetical protein
LDQDWMQMMGAAADIQKQKEWFCITFQRLLL